MYRGEALIDLPAGKKSVLEGIEKQNFVDVGRVFCITSKRSRSLCNGSEKGRTSIGAKVTGNGNWPVGLSLTL